MLLLKKTVPESLFNQVVSLTDRRPAALKETLAQVFSCEFSRNFHGSFSSEHPPSDQFWHDSYFPFCRSMIFPSRHGCISDASLRRLMQRLRDISKRADLQISETSPVRCIKDVSSETSLRSLRSSQRRLWVASETAISFFQTEAFFSYLLIYLRVFKYFANLI